MPSSAFESARSGSSVLVSETNVEPLQLVGRVGHFLSAARVVMAE